MSIRALFATTLTAALLAAGAFVMMQAQGATLGDFLSALTLKGGVENGAILCFLLALGAVLGALLALISAFSAFRELDEDEYDNRLPYGAAPFFGVIALAFFWFAMGCGGGDDETLDESLAGASAAPALTAPTPEPEPPAPVLAAPEPPAPAEPETADLPPPAPQVEQYAHAAPWPYQYPLIRNGRAAAASSTAAFLSGLFPDDDPSGAVSALLCNKAWVAVAGATSEEGPAERNVIRARARAALTARRAEDWLSAQTSSTCTKPVIIPVTLGQHAPLLANENGTPGATAYQREPAFISRALDADETALSAADARAEVRAFLNDSANRRAILGARRYNQAPALIDPGL
ncbi:MAG: hypothetical protein AAGA09_08525 [Pseudomonadota bacterium]